MPNTRKKVILYNPKAVFYDMPLALIAIGSHLDQSIYEPIIIDARISKNPLKEIKKHLEDAVCFGVTCLTGAPLKDAMHVSEQVKMLAPDLPVVWGGWHTSLFQKEPLVELNYVNITVQGQGEKTFKELVEALATTGDISTVDGLCYRDDNGKVLRNKPRATNDINGFSKPDYSLINVQDYFDAKENKQLDFITSAGCFFRCTFCADPFVFNRKFTSLNPVYVVDQLEELQKKYHFTDLNFQDETFFTYKDDILEMARLIVEKGLKFTWAATMRADQGHRMTIEDFELCKKSGLRRLLIGVESGSQEMMDWLKKDIKMEHIWEAAERCQQLDIAVIFPFIVGFPDESDRSIRETKKTIKKLRTMSPKFETPVFYFKPYPGSAITQEVVKNGYQLPKTTEEWAEFDYIGSHGPWVTPEKYLEFERLKFFLKLAYKPTSRLLRPMQSIAKWRLKKDNYTLPIEKVVFDKLYRSKSLS